MADYDCLIVDDEIALSQSTCEYFNIYGILTYWVSGKRECFEFLENNRTKLILLDINLGETSGFEICRSLRESTDVPILFISARNSDDDILLALNIGGDDYIQKPYSLSVLTAKVKAVLKRYGKEVDVEKQEKKEDEFGFGDFLLDIRKEVLTKNGKTIPLKSMECRLLRYMLENKNRILTKEELFQKVWKDAITTDGTLNVHIRRLREKIEEDPNVPKYILTKWGTGYLFCSEE